MGFCGAILGVLGPILGSVGVGFVVFFGWFFLWWCVYLVVLVI
jgi:Co/Zn/Cd efflux system component